jgi:hypothetical protein
MLRITREFEIDTVGLRRALAGKLRIRRLIAAKNAHPFGHFQLSQFVV